MWGISKTGSPRSRSTLGLVVPSHPDENLPSSPHSLCLRALLSARAEPGPGRPGSPVDGESGKDRVSRQGRALPGRSTPGDASHGPDGSGRQRMATDAQHATHHHFGSLFSGPLLSFSPCPGRPASPQCSAPEKSPETSQSSWTQRGRGPPTSATLWLATTESRWLEGPGTGPLRVLLRETLIVGSLDFGPAVSL